MNPTRSGAEPEASASEKKLEDPGFLERWGLWTAIGVVLAILVGWACILHTWGDEWSRAYDWTERGQIGDSFGAVNALFSGLAFACLIIALRLQRKELALQREELSLTRDELSKSAEAQEATAKAQRAIALMNAYRTIRGSYSDKIAFLEREVAERRSRAYRTDSTGLVDVRNMEAEIAVYRNRCLVMERRMEGILLGLETEPTEAAEGDGES